MICFILGALAIVTMAITINISVYTSYLGVTISNYEAMFVKHRAFDLQVNAGRPKGA